MGYKAYDYDILDDYGQTDFQVDLFSEIEKSYNGENSIFDDISQDDLIMAFFPCVRFEDQIMVHMRCQCNTQKDWSLIDKLEYSMKLQSELEKMYMLISKLVIVCVKNEFKIVIENPYSVQHYLKQYWCIQPSIIDKDRTQNGDWMKKPTQYYFIGFKPKNNLVFKPIDYVERQVFKKIVNSKEVKRKERRSEIHPQYANRFIRQYIIDTQQH